MRSALFLALLAPAAAFWRLPCQAPITIERADPIVNPGVISGHAHTVMGASGFSAISTPESIRQSRCSTCIVKEDMSNYWIQNLYYQYPNGSFTSVPQNGGMLVYYLQRTGSKDKNISAFPYGLRMVAGYPGKQTFENTLQARAISYACLNYNGGGGPETHAFPQKNCPNNLRVQVFFPSCWNGVDLDSADHRSHMAYPSNVDSGDCPATHPIRLISIFFEIFYNTERFAAGWLDANGKPFRAQPFFWSTGDNTGYGHHGDFMNGWDQGTLAKAVAECTADSGVVQDCPHFTFWTNQEAAGCKPEYLPVTDDRMEGYMPTMPGLGPISVPSFNPCGQSPQAGNDSTPVGQPLGACTTGFSGGKAYTSPVSGGDAANTGEPARVELAPNPIRQDGYLGCYNAGTGTMDRRLGSGNSYTVDTCRALAKQNNYIIFAMQYYGECWVTNSTTSYKSQGVSTLCVGECNADPQYFCGYGSVNQVYSTWDLTPPITPPPTPGMHTTAPSPTFSGATYGPTTVRVPTTRAPTNTRAPTVFGATNGPTTAGAPTASGLSAANRLQGVFGVVMALLAVVAALQ